MAIQSICTFLYLPICFIFPKRIRLMSGSVRAKHCAGIEIISVGFRPPDMVRWKAQGVKVLLGTDDREQVVVSLVPWETGFDELAGDGQGVVGLSVEAARDGGEDAGRGVHP